MILIDTDTERMPLVGDDYIDTRDERWAMGDSAWYGAASEFAERTLGKGHGKRCLVIGSPVPEVKRLKKDGWHTLYVDVREPDQGVGHWFILDATALPSWDNTYDAVSSTCVVCHAGLGRYGDPIKPNGDVLMMREIFRVLKPGGLAAIMLGPATPQMTQSVVYGNVHRIYEPDEAHAMCRDVGFEVVESQLSINCGAEPMGAPEVEERIGEGVLVRYCYLSVLLRKPE